MEVPPPHAWLPRESLSNERDLRDPLTSPQLCSTAPSESAMCTTTPPRFAGRMHNTVHKHPPPPWLAKRQSPRQRSYSRSPGPSPFTAPGVETRSNFEDSFANTYPPTNVDLQSEHTLASSCSEGHAPRRQNLGPRMMPPSYGPREASSWRPATDGSADDGNFRQDGRFMENVEPDHMHFQNSYQMTPPAHVGRPHWGNRFGNSHEEGPMERRRSNSEPCSWAKQPDPHPLPPNPSCPGCERMGHLEARFQYEVKQNRELRNEISILQKNLKTLHTRLSARGRERMREVRALEGARGEFELKLLDVRCQLAEQRQLNTQLKQRINELERRHEEPGKGSVPPQSDGAGGSSSQESSSVDPAVKLLRGSDDDDSNTSQRAQDNRGTSSSETQASMNSATGSSQGSADPSLNSTSNQGSAIPSTTGSSGTSKGGGNTTMENATSPAPPASMG